MIRIVRPPAEPKNLVACRATRLPAARAALAAGQSPDLSGYEVVKDTLFEIQRRKCCYCEKRQEQAKYRDVEHFRPKATYWWLAWTWDNLLFACNDCNREYKREQFPLAPGGTKLVPEEPAPGGELALLIDPCDPAIDPLAEIEFRRHSFEGRERWKPYGRTDRGRETIRVCGLDRPGLVDLYRVHVVDVVRPKLEPLFVALREGEPRAVTRAWDQAQRALLGPERPFRALSYDALKVLVAADVRARWRLQLAHLT